MQGNIIGVFVNGIEVSRDDDLIDEPSFKVVTSRDNHYLIERVPGRSFTWEVWHTSRSGVEVGIVIGRVIGVRSLFARAPTSFSYASSHHPLDSGVQNDFLNAVQSLTD